MSVAHIVSSPVVVSATFSLIEHRILTYHLFRLNTAGIPQIYHFGQEGLHNILIIDLLGPSLEDLFDMCGRKFHIKTVCMAARQMVRVASRFCLPSFLDPVDSRDLSNPVAFFRSQGCKPSTKRT